MSLNLQIISDKIESKQSAFDSLKDYSTKDSLIHQTLRSVLLNYRQGNAHTKTRGEVRGGGKKPWRQKGTGRARHGSRRSPIWVGGGVTHGPRNTVNWHRKINKSAKLATLKSLIKSRLENNSGYLFDKGFSYTKTKEALKVLSLLIDPKTKQKQPRASVVIIYHKEDKGKLDGFTNTNAELLNVDNLKLDVLAAKHNLIFTPIAQRNLEEKITK